MFHIFWVNNGKLETEVNLTEDDALEAVASYDSIINFVETYIETEQITYSDDILINNITDSYYNSIVYDTFNDDNNPFKKTIYKNCNMKLYQVDVDKIGREGLKHYIAEQIKEILSCIIH